jgi:hypothetical protein
MRITAACRANRCSRRPCFACDELAGFLTACAYVQPSKSIADVQVKSVRKKLKDKAFARSVSREDILNGAQELGVDLDEHIGVLHSGDDGAGERVGRLGQHFADHFALHIGQAHVAAVVEIGQLLVIQAHQM